MYKTKRRIKNSASYDRSLVRRGDIIAWPSTEAIAKWEPSSIGKCGGQVQYSGIAIEPVQESLLQAKEG